jgi:hypothetical protein
MTRRRKWLLGIVLLVFVLAVGTVGLGAATAIRQGTIQVRVDSGGREGGQFGLAVPAALVDVALLLAPVHLLEQEVPVEEIRPYLPVLRELSRQVDTLPDAVLVEVSGPDEHVRIEKRDGRFVVEVVGADERVHVSVPVSTVTRAMRTVQRLG